MPTAKIPTIRIHNSETGEILDREMTAEEIAQMEQENALLQQKMTEQQAKIAAKQAVLSKLGLTDEEAAALLA
jgi:hypothetical protein